MRKKDLIKSIVKRSIINIKFAIDFLFKKHRCILCNNSKNLSLIFKSWPYYYWRCNSCDLIFAGNPLPDNLSRLYVQNSHLFPRMHKSNWQVWQDWKIETFRHLGFFTFEETLKGEEKKVLEIGSDEGKLLEIFKKRGWNVLGVEPNEHFARICKISGLDVVNGYIEDISLPDQYFNLVIATHLLEHLKNPHIFLQKVFQILKDNGRLILEIPISKDYCNATHLFYFSRRSLTNLLEKNLFIIIKEFGYTDKVYQCESLAIMAEKSKG